MNFSPHFMCFVKHTKRYVVPKYSQYLLVLSIIKIGLFAKCGRKFVIFSPHLFIRTNKKARHDVRAFGYLLAIILHLPPYLTFQQDLRLHRLR